MLHSPTVRLVALFTLLLSFATAAFAQKDTGGIGGTVKDSTGAVVAGAKVTVTDADRGTSEGTTTDAQGGYLKFYF
jgi:hypothetical protein